MTTITTQDGTRIFYKDWGVGRPVVFSHGWPLNADAWDAQMLFLVQHGYRVIAHDRRGHGRSGNRSPATTWTRMPTISRHCSTRSTCAMPRWSAIRRAAARSRVTLAVTGRSGSRRPC